MIVERQENSITKGMHERLQPKGPHNAPEVPRALLEWLEANYPPRCYEPANENLEAHLQYAGKVSLVQFLRASFSETSDDIALSALADDNSLAAMIEREYFGGTD